MAEIPFSNPKTYPVRRDVQTTKGSVGILMFLGLVLFLVALLLLGGVFFYKRLVSNQIEDINLSLNRLEADFDPPIVQEMNRVSKSIENAKTLLNSHRSASKVFDFLEKNTLSDVAFSSFSLAGPNSEVALAGESRGYGVLAKQVDTFKSDPAVTSVTFSNLALSETGGVVFAMRVVFDPNLFSFK